MQGRDALELGQHRLAVSGRLAKQLGPKAAVSLFSPGDLFLDIPALSLTAARSRGKGRGFPLQDGHARPQPLSQPYSQQA